MIRLPDLQFELRDWQDHEFTPIRRAEEKVREIGKKAGKNSDKFKDACEKLLTIVMTGNVADIPGSIQTSIDVRAFTFLLLSAKEFIEEVKLNQVLLDALLAPRFPMSKLSLTQLVRVFFEQYDSGTTSETLKECGTFIQEQLRHFEGRTGSSDLVTYSRNSSILFSLTGPADVVAHVRSNNLDFDEALTKLSLTVFSNSRFLILCRYQYYLDTLKSIPVGSDHEILHEIVKKDVVNAPFDSERQLGHAILEVLIDRSANGKLSDPWQRAILTIAGDPRVPRSSPNYQRWWSLLGDKRIALMRGWLSRFDLALFLGILEQSAKDSSNDDMVRMFGPRKVFMEGLLDQEVVRESRLFLTTSAESYLIQKYKKDELPSYARVSGGPASVIYLRLDNDIHFVEGTHSFSIRIMNKLPKRAQLHDYSMRTFVSRDLGVGLGESYYGDYQGDGGLLETKHYPDLSWQNKAMEHLEKIGLKLFKHKLISPESHRDYKWKFGAF